MSFQTRHAARTQVWPALAAGRAPLPLGTAPAAERRSVRPPAPSKKGGILARARRLALSSSIAVLLAALAVQPDRSFASDARKSKQAAKKLELAAAGSRAKAVEARAVRISSEITSPVLLSRVEPQVPARFVGKAIRYSAPIVECVIDESGVPHVLRALRYEERDCLDEMVKAIEKWRYEPARDKHGKPIAVFFVVLMNHWC